MPASPPRHPVAGLSLTLALALALSACGGDGDEPAEETSPEPEPSVALPTGDVEVPEGTELTPAGTELEFGDTATVAYQAGRKSSVVELTVRGAQTGRIRQLRAFQLDEATRRSTPYYVRVQVTNAGTGDLGGAAVPLFAVDGDNTLVQASSFTSAFDRCPSRPLPQEFGPGEEATACLVYLLPDGGELEAMSYRPLQSFEPVLWTGEVRPAGD